MDEWTALGNMLKSAWQLFKTPMELPFIGHTSPLGIMLFLAVLGYAVDIVSGMLGGKNSE